MPQRSLHRRTFTLCNAGRSQRPIPYRQFPAGMETRQNTRIIRSVNHKWSQTQLARLARWRKAWEESRPGHVANDMRAPPYLPSSTRWRDLPVGSVDHVYSFAISPPVPNNPSRVAVSPAAGADFSSAAAPLPFPSSEPDSSNGNCSVKVVPRSPVSSFKALRL